MTAITFPFWILIPEGADPLNGCDAPEHVCTFSSAARAIAYMEAQSAGTWEIKLVARTSRPEIQSFFDRTGIRRVCHDQNSDGSGGTSLTVDELMPKWDL